MKLSFSSLFWLTLVLFMALCSNSAHAVTPSNVDVVMERLDIEGHTREGAGWDVVNNDAEQTLAEALLPGYMHTFRVRIRNTGQSAASFQVNLGGLLSSTGEETAWSPKGWEGYATLEGSSTNLLTQLQSKEGWKTPVIKAEKEFAFRFSVTAPSIMVAPVPEGSFRISVSNGTSRDMVVGKIEGVFITKIQWTLDADSDHPDRWHDVTDSTVITVEQFSVVGFRALKSSSADWPDPLPLGPDWSWQDGSVEGEEVWLHARNATAEAETIRVTPAPPVAIKIRVTPDDATIVYDK